MRPIDGDEAIRAIPKWKRYGVDEEGKLSEWKTGSPAYVNLEEVLDTIARMPTIDISDGWIPVTERLPEEEDLYFVTEKYSHLLSTRVRFFSPNLATVEMNISDFRGECRPGWYDYEDMYEAFEVTEYVVAWMPLPKPYKGGGQ